MTPILSTNYAMKYFKFGLEFEMFTLDQSGRIVNEAPRVIQRVQAQAPRIAITKESSQNIVELGTRPHENVHNFLAKVMRDFETVLYHAQQEGLLLYPFGTYPGKNAPEFNQDGRYQIKEKLFGKTRWRIAGRCVGMHAHYALPWGVYDTDTKNIKSLTYSKNKQSLVNIYNMFIAMDPALVTFAQSSPFYEGRYAGKDGRVIHYRGGHALDNPDGLYANHPQFGGLQPYETTGSDLTYIIKRRFGEWKRIVEEIDPAEQILGKHGSILDTTWNPVKINAHGTMEQRGMDMNLPSVITALAVIIKYIGKAIQHDFIPVLPCDEGILHPFKLTDQGILIPPHTYVRHYLQRLSAYEGLDNDTVLEYSKALMKLAKKLMPSSRLPLLKPLEAMLRKRETVSDQIINTAKRLGIKTDGKSEMSGSDAAKLALTLSEGLHQEIKMTRQALEAVGE